MIDQKLCKIHMSCMCGGACASHDARFETYCFHRSEHLRIHKPLRKRGVELRQQAWLTCRAWVKITLIKRPWPLFWGRDQNEPELGSCESTCKRALQHITEYLVMDEFLNPRRPTRYWAFRASRASRRSGIYRIPPHPA